MILQIIGMIVLVGVGIYAFVGGIIATYVACAFSGGKGPFLFLIWSAIGALLIWAGFYLSPFGVVIK